MSDKPILRGFAPVRILGDPNDAKPRNFVELWDTKSWPDVVSHLATLSGVSNVKFEDAGPDKPGLTFIYEEHSFSFYRACGDYMGVVEKADCPDEVLLRVAHHLNYLLCPTTTFLL